MAELPKQPPEEENLSTIRHTGTGGDPSGSAPTEPPSAPSLSTSDAPTAEHPTTPPPRTAAEATMLRSGGPLTPPVADQTPPRSSVSLDAPDTGGINPGQILFDRYVVERLLGAGGMGTVWLVKHKVLGVERALKLIKPQIAFDPKTRADFRREAMIMANLHHPHAVVVHDAQIGSEIAYIEMEFLEGKSVEKQLSKGEPMPLDWVARILEQLCILLQFVHDKQIIHRDLKPSNLLLLADRPVGQEFLKVLDFGIAKSFRNDPGESDDMKTQTGGAKFTPHYASPEQVGGAKDVDHRSDLYSVGVILYEFLTGFRPFAEPGLVYKHLCVPAPRFAETNPACKVPPEIEAVVLSCLEKDPAKRPQSATQLFENFMAAVEQAGLTIDQPSPIKTRAGMTGSPGTARTIAMKTGATEVPTKTGKAEPGSKKLVVAAVGVLVLVGIFWGLSNYWNRPDTPLTGDPPIGATTEPGKSRTPEPRPVVKRALAFGYTSDKDAKIGPDGWPEEIIAETSGRHFVRFAPGVYIPDRFEAEDAKDLVNGFPRVLVSRRPGGGRFVRIEGGSFTMGGILPGGKGPEGSEIQPDVPAHKVTLPDYYLQQTEVTNAQMKAFRDQEAVPVPRDWRDFAAGLGDGAAEKLMTRPATFVTRMEAAQYARFVGGRLPTEAEWEYAARSRGNAQPYVWGTDPPTTDLTNINNAESQKMSPIPLSEPGKYTRDQTKQGVVDLSGNAREWCFDVFAPYLPKEIEQPSSPELKLDPGLRYVVRGSSFFYESDRCGVSARTSELGGQLAPDLGFRIVLEVPPVMKGEN